MNFKGEIVPVHLKEGEMQPTNRSLHLLRAITRKRRE